jgi:acetylornithine deacetylase/succinyl-diaminopimelate desuccinylase-like protein
LDAELLNELDQKYVLSKLEEMIKIPSVVGKEGEIADYLKQELESLGLKTETDTVRPNRPNIYARLKGKKSGKRIHFNGHTDTVPVVDGWDHDPYDPVIEGNKIYGLGSNDMKGGIARAQPLLNPI